MMKVPPTDKHLGFIWREANQQTITLNWIWRHQAMQSIANLKSRTWNLSPAWFISRKSKQRRYCARCKVVNVTKVEVANASSSISLDKHSQWDERRLSENSLTTLNKANSKTNITIKSLVVTELVTTVLSINVTAASMNAVVKTSGVAKQISFLLTTPTVPLTQHII